MSCLLDKYEVLKFFTDDCSHIPQQCYIRFIFKYSLTCCLLTCSTLCSIEVTQDADNKSDIKGLKSVTFEMTFDIKKWDIVNRYTITKEMKTSFSNCLDKLYYMILFWFCF